MKIDTGEAVMFGAMLALFALLLGVLTASGIIHWGH